MMLMPSSWPSPRPWPQMSPSTSSARCQAKSAFGFTSASSSRRSQSACSSASACLDRSEQLGPFAIVLGLGVAIRLRFFRQRCVDVDFVHAVEERVELVELALRDRVELVIVTFGAADRQRQPHGADGDRAIHRLPHAKLLQIGAALAIAERVAQKAGGDSLLDRRDPGNRSPASCSIVN